MAHHRFALKKIKLPIHYGFLRYFFILTYICAQLIFPKKVFLNESRWYALLIGGGANKQDCLDSFYSNITYANSTLLKLGYHQRSLLSTLLY